MTWNRMCPSSTSAIRALNAPRQAEIVCRISEESASRSIALSIASTCPRMRRTRLSIFFLSRSMWASGHLLNYLEIVYPTWYTLRYEFFAFDDQDLSSRDHKAHGNRPGFGLCWL